MEYFSMNESVLSWISTETTPPQNRGMQQITKWRHLETSGSFCSSQWLLPSEKNWQCPISWKHQRQLLHHERSGLELRAALARVSWSPSSWETWCRLSGQRRRISQCHLFPRGTWPLPRAASPLIQSDDTEASRLAAPRKPRWLGAKQLRHAARQQLVLFV